MKQKFVIILLTVGILTLAGCSSESNSTVNHSSTEDYPVDTVVSESTDFANAVSTEQVETELMENTEIELTESTVSVIDDNEGPIITREDYFTDYPLTLNSGELVYVGRVPGFDFYPDIEYKVQDLTCLQDYKENDILAFFPGVCSAYGMQFVSGCEMHVLHNEAGYYINYWSNYTTTEIESFDNGLSYTLYEMSWKDGHYIKYVLIANIGDEEIVVELPHHPLDEEYTVALLEYYKNSVFEPLVITDDNRIGNH